MLNQDQLEIDPVWIDAIIDAVVWLNPIPIDVAGIGFSVQKLPSM